MFTHDNLRLPPRVDTLLRLLIVMPDTHRIHYPAIKRETNSNYGFNLSIWDRLLGTYRAQPQRGHEDMGIGLRSVSCAKATKPALAATALCRQGRRIPD